MTLYLLCCRAAALTGCRSAQEKKRTVIKITVLIWQITLIIIQWVSEFTPCQFRG